MCSVKQVLFIYLIVFFFASFCFRLLTVSWDITSTFIFFAYLLQDTTDLQSSCNTNRGGSGTDKILIHIIYMFILFIYLINTWPINQNRNFCTLKERHSAIKEHRESRFKHGVHFFLWIIMRYNKTFLFNNYRYTVTESPYSLRAPSIILHID